jgi:hypothetical protein
MTPTTQYPLDPNNLSFYNWVQALCAYIMKAYDIPFVPTWVTDAQPGVNSTNPDQVDRFYLTSPYYAGLGTVFGTYQRTFGNNFAPVAAIVLNTLCYPNPAPQPISLLPVVVVPPPPSNPIGIAYQHGSDIEYTDLGSPSIPVGGTFTDPAGKVYVKMGRQTPFGMSTWFVEKAV